MSNIAKNIGKILAYIQDTVDVFFGWGFHKLKSLPNEKGKKQHPIKKGIKYSFKIFGQIGDSFYQEYEKLKKRKK